MKIQGKTRKERINYQLDQWVLGNYIHNEVDGECCPDFACCRSDIRNSKVTRDLFKAASDKGDEDTKMSMLMDFFGTAIATYKPKTKVYITDGKQSNQDKLN